MSCEKCDTEPITGAFYRWKTANIEIIACKEHWLEVREALNNAQANKLTIAVEALEKLTKYAMPREMVVRNMDATVSNMADMCQIVNEMAAIAKQALDRLAEGQDK